MVICQYIMQPCIPLPYSMQSHVSVVLYAKLITVLCLFVYVCLQPLCHVWYFCLQMCCAGVDRCVTSFHDLQFVITLFGVHVSGCGLWVEVVSIPIKLMTQSLQLQVPLQLGTDVFSLCTTLHIVCTEDMYTHAQGDPVYICTVCWSSYPFHFSFFGDI